MEEEFESLEDLFADNRKYYPDLFHLMGRNYLRTEIFIVAGTRQVGKRQYQAIANVFLEPGNANRLASKLPAGWIPGTGYVITTKYGNVEVRNVKFRNGVNIDFEDKDNIEGHLKNNLKN